VKKTRDLTWRDIQHITVLSSKRNRLFDPYLKHHWKFNGAGLQFNHLFGYGVLDAGAMVDLAHKWKPLPERFHCTAGSVIKKIQTPATLVQFVYPFIYLPPRASYIIRLSIILTLSVDIVRRLI
jgi:hypothetical protein